jgi:hypothetical protein
VISVAELYNKTEYLAVCNREGNGYTLTFPPIIHGKNKREKHVYHIELYDGKMIIEGCDISEVVESANYALLTLNYYFFCLKLFDYGFNVPYGFALLDNGSKLEEINHLEFFKLNSDPKCVLLMNKLQEIQKTEAQDMTPAKLQEIKDLGIEEGYCLLRDFLEIGVEND